MNKWYWSCRRLNKSERFIGIRTEILEYAIYWYIGFWFFQIYANDWMEE